MNWKTALSAAREEAELYRGATSPNPPVGAAALDQSGRILAVAAHQRAGEPHAERLLLERLENLGLLQKLHTVVVTLEPCSHHGRTPPCTEALLAANVARVVFAVRDPHPKAQGGEAVLRRAGVEVVCLADSASSPEFQAVERQLGPFLKVVRTGIPWITVKRALDEKGGMVPPPGQKTFTSPESLRLAHLLRRRADAILTGSGTVLADQPEFTVRHVTDHFGKKRILVIADRQRRVERDAPEYLEAAHARGFEVLLTPDWRQELRELSKRGVLEVLVEEGPELSDAVLRLEWDEHWVFQKTREGSDAVSINFRDSR
jgi:diaminohydroxyphosphoribosylaminopyrimidine deaminase/5-amino-6-(5-phosphoribosylamino)uracil reductase